MPTRSARNNISKKTQGLRTCIVCRQKAPLYHLVRLVRNVNGLVCVVPGMPQHGRGYHVCPTSHCFEKAVGNKSPLRELGANNAVALLQFVLINYNNRLTILHKSGGLLKAHNIELMVARLQDALKTLSCRSGEAHVR